MGGGALKKLPKGKETRRYQKEEFDTLSNVLLPKIRKVFNTEAELVESYRNKETFGDMDILVLNNGLGIDIGNVPKDSNFSKEVEKLIETFEPNEIHKNGNVYSFDYNRLQIDLILVEKENWECSNIFYKWGDLGNFMGKIINSYGNLNDGIILKYGYDGIKAHLIYENKRKEVFLSKDNRRGFEFLDLDFEKYKQGFDTKEEVFDYITTSKFYSHKSFQWENLNSRNKQRNKRRKDFHLFLEYIEKYKNYNIEYNEPKEYYLNEIKEFFGVDLEKEHQDLKDKVNFIKKVNSKFNGRHILNTFDVNPKDMNELISNFRKIIKSKYGDYNNFILETPLDIILENFKQINEL